MTVVSNEYERGENSPMRTLIKELFATAYMAHLIATLLLAALRYREPSVKNCVNFTTPTTGQRRGHHRDRSFDKLRHSLTLPSNM